MRDAVNLIAQLGGESITYLSYGGSLTTFPAIVERKPTQVQSANGYSYAANVVEVLIPRDATAGVLTVKERLDKVRFKRNLSDAQDTEWTVTKIVQEDAGLGSDAGLFRVQVQA
jgi:hypothetical protein